MQLGKTSSWSISRLLWLCFLPLIIIIILMVLIFALQSSQIEQTTYILLGILATVGVLVEIASIFTLSKWITKPLREIMEGAEIVDSGKLDYRSEI